MLIAIFILAGILWAYDICRYFVHGKSTYLFSTALLILMTWQQDRTLGIIALIGGSIGFLGMLLSDYIGSK